MRTLVTLVKLAAVGALVFMLFRCDTHLKEKYEPPRYHVPQS